MSGLFCILVLLMNHLFYMQMFLVLLPVWSPTAQFSWSFPLIEVSPPNIQGLSSTLHLASSSVYFDIKYLWQPMCCLLEGAFSLPLSQVRVWSSDLYSLKPALGQLHHIFLPGHYLASLLMSGFLTAPIIGILSQYRSKFPIYLILHLLNWFAIFAPSEFVIFIFPLEYKSCNFFFYNALQPISEQTIVCQVSWVLTPFS